MPSVKRLLRLPSRLGRLRPSRSGLCDEGRAGDIFSGDTTLTVLERGVRAGEGRMTTTALDSALLSRVKLVSNGIPKGRVGGG